MRTRMRMGVKTKNFEVMSMRGKDGGDVERSGKGHFLSVVCKQATTTLQTNYVSPDPSFYFCH